MICPGCGSTSVDRLETCRRCGAPMAATAVGLSAGAPQDRQDEFVRGVQGLRLEPEPSSPPCLDMTLPADLEPDENDGGSPFRIDDDLFSGYSPESFEQPGTAAVAPAWLHQSGFAQGSAVDLPGPVFALPDEEHGTPADSQAIIDRDGEVPERYWAPEIAGLGRRALALLVDQAVLAAMLGIFFLGAFLSLRLSGFDTEFFLAAAGLQAAALPFALLAALISLVYHAFFHGSSGRTPGKALAGVEVRTGAGAGISLERAILRWFCSALGLACAGAGVAWALFEPRRRGWADLLSGTVIARRRRSAR